MRISVECVRLATFSLLLLLLLFLLLLLLFSSDSRDSLLTASDDSAIGVKTKAAHVVVAAGYRRRRHRRANEFRRPGHGDAAAAVDKASGSEDGGKGPLMLPPVPPSSFRRDDRVRNFNINIVPYDREEFPDEDEMKEQQTTDWCSLDTGYNVIKDKNGHRHKAYISLTREGFVWLRLGKEYSSFDWSSSTAQKKVKVQTPVVDDEMIQALKTLEFGDICILTDLDLSLKMESGWNPSYMTVYDPLIHETIILSFKNIKNCKVSTKIELTEDKQNLLCTSDGPERFTQEDLKLGDTSTDVRSGKIDRAERGLVDLSEKQRASKKRDAARNFSNQYQTNPGGQLHSCGLRSLPMINQPSPTWFIKYVNFDLLGSDHWYCPSSGADNKFTFSGSFYHVYLKMASCQRPKDSRMLGHDVKLRSREDKEENRVIIFDPSMRAMADGWVHSWHYYAQVVSIHHFVSIQIWRPCGNTKAEENSDEFCFTLIGQSQVYPRELHFHEMFLSPAERLHVKRGDVIGLYHRRSNPIGWSCVPCSPSTPDQHHLIFPEPGERDLSPGRIFHFVRSRSFAPDSQSRPRSYKRGKDSSDHPERAINSNEQPACPCRQYSVAALFANKSRVKTIDSWQCPGRQKRERNRDGTLDRNSIPVPSSISSPSLYSPSFSLSSNHTRTHEETKFHHSSSPSSLVTPSFSPDYNHHHHQHHRHYPPHHHHATESHFVSEPSVHDGTSSSLGHRTKISGKHVARYMYFSTSIGDADVMCLVIVLLTILILGFFMLLIGSLSFYKACHMKTS